MKSIDMSKVRNVCGTVALFAGVLAIANVDSVWEAHRSGGSVQETHALVNNGHIWQHTKAQLADGESARKPLQSDFSRSLEGDELHDQNPYAHLSSLDPLQEILRKGVLKFRRETYRSPSYQEESGYDLISYDIEHADHSKSSILAYLEKVEGSQERVPFVVFMVSKEDGQSAHYSFYRGGNLVEQNDLTVDEAQALVAQRVGSGIPFLSLSR